MARLLSPVQANLVDRAVTYFAPERGVRRMRARLQLFGAGGYTGARTDRAALKEWNPRLDSADSATIPDLARLRSRHRDLIRNMPLAAAAIGVTEVNAVGTGLFPIPTPDAEYLGLTAEEAAAWAAKAERIWWWWAGSRGCDITRRLNHAGQQRLVLRSQLESGDVLVVRRFRKGAADALGLKLQIIEADRISTPHDRLSDPTIIEGVEFDADGMPVAFYVADEHPGAGWFQRIAGRDRLTWTRVPAFGPDGQPNVVHLFDALRPGQTRGVPLLAACIERLKQADRAVHAEQMAQVVAGMIVYSIETPEGESVLRPASQTVGEIEEDEADGEVKVDYGAILGLAKGEELKMHSPNRPGTTWEPFQLHIAREVGAAVGIPQGVLLHWFSKAYSASRGEWMLAWKHWAVRRDRIAYEFSGTVYGWLIEEAVARGYLDAPGFFDDPFTRAAWLGCEWRGAPPGQLDPLKEIQAIKERRNLLISTIAQDTAEVTGADWRENAQQIAAERALYRSLGIDPTAELTAERIITEPRTPVDPGEDPDEADRREEEETS